MLFEQFQKVYGKPKELTGVSVNSLGLSNSESLREFESEIGGGIFSDGLISLLSVREQVNTLCGWEKYLPDGMKLFGTSAFGFLMLTSGEDLYLIDTQYGEIVESDYSLKEFINSLGSIDIIQEIIKVAQFELWNTIGGKLKANEVLNPTPAIALGGTFEVIFLKPMSLEIYLSFTGGLFSIDGGMPAEVIRLATWKLCTVKS